MKSSKSFIDSIIFHNDGNLHYDFKYIDVHTHFFPHQIFKAIWNFFEIPDENGNILGWSINYKFSPEKQLKFLKARM